MNIFWLDNDPYMSAQYHVDRHIVKMPLELAQLMCTAHHELGTATDEMYKPTHRNHPCAVWVREAAENYNECYSLFLSLLQEYTYRYGRVHGCSRLTEALMCAPADIEGLPATDKPQAMPDTYKHSDPVVAYRTYYLKEKYQLAGWRKRFDPPWWR